MIVIRGVGKALPKRKMMNADFPPELETSDEWIKTHTGIQSRYVASKDETTSYLGTVSCKHALEAAKINGFAVDVLDIDVLICTTVTPDYAGFPSTACLIQKDLGAANAFVMDLSAACAGFLYALETAASLMEHRKLRYALVCGSELLTTVTDWKDRATCVLFGDGAGTVLLERIEDTNKKRGLGSVVLGADGNGYKDLYLNEHKHTVMNGRSVYNFAVGKIAEIIEELLKKETLTIDDVDYVVCHQANERIISAAAKRLGYDESKFIVNLQQYGNTSSSTIPIALADMCEQKKLKEGMTLILAGFGAGLTWGGCVIRW